MTNTIDTAAAESLRNFAVTNGEFAFAHLVTAALAGEEWAMQRTNLVLLKIGRLSLQGSQSHFEAKLEIIRTTDTTRPDGAIARSFQP